jgi:flagellar protein FlbD
MRAAKGPTVIEVNRLHGAGSMVVNADLIETIEACPDTTITLVTRRKFVVEENLSDVVNKVLDYRRSVVATGAPASVSEIGEAA